MKRHKKHQKRAVANGTPSKQRFRSRKLGLLYSRQNYALERIIQFESEIALGQETLERMGVMR